MLHKDKHILLTQNNAYRKTFHRPIMNNVWQCAVQVAVPPYRYVYFTTGFKYESYYR
jgi:hypothetical protein